MKISVILAHPKQGSFNHAIADAVTGTLRQHGHEIFFHDLYTEGFDPVLHYSEISRDAVLPDMISRHCEEIREADGIVFVHPDWWGMPPAVLKGYIDRVFRPGITYRFLEGDGGEGVPMGFSGQKLHWFSIPPIPRYSVNWTPLEIRLNDYGRTVYAISAGSRSSGGGCLV